MTSSSRTIAPPRTALVAAAGRAAGLVIALLVASGVSIPFARTAERPVPKPLGYVSDFAGVVDAASADSMTALAAEVRQKAGAELAVVTLADLGGETIDPVAVSLFEEWGIGRQGRDDGVLILLAVAERKVRIEVGYGLEGPLPDGRCGAIIRRVMGPDLAAGRYGAGLLAGARAVAGAIAVERGVTITGSIAAPSAGGSRREAPAWVLLVLFVTMLLFGMLASRASRRGYGGPYGGGRRRPGGWNDPWGGFGGGMGGFGGGGFGGGGGGGFGGFGGGRSGGGGASGGF